MTEDMWMYICSANWRREVSIAFLYYYYYYYYSDYVL